MLTTSVSSNQVGAGVLKSTLVRAVFVQHYIAQPDIALRETRLAQSVAGTARVACRIARSNSMVSCRHPAGEPITRRPDDQFV
jgi:hypothetical protein